MPLQMEACQHRQPHICLPNHGMLHIESLKQTQVPAQSMHKRLQDLHGVKPSNAPPNTRSGRTRRGLRWSNGSCATAVIQLDCVNKSAHADQLLHLLRIELRTSRLLNGCSTNGAPDALCDVPKVEILRFLYCALCCNWSFIDVSCSGLRYTGG